MSPYFFNYFPVAPAVRKWGVYATAFGRGVVPPLSAYPPARHPKSHYLDLERGRVLREYQIIYISDGEGTFSSPRSGDRKISKGTVFLLFPGIRHRYRPNPSTGWTEWWIEVQGTQFDRLRREEIITPNEPVCDLRECREIKSLFEEADWLAHTKPPGFTVRIGNVAMQILTHLHWKNSRRSVMPHRMTEIISEAQSLLSQETEQPLSPDELARKMGVGYSYFRRTFKEQTGLSPKQYQLEVRHRQAKHLLRTTHLSIKEIAERLGYHSPYHFSLDFTKRAGTCPSNWKGTKR